MTSIFGVPFGEGMRKAKLRRGMGKMIGKEWK
jgi:hypothetical protein